MENSVAQAPKQNLMQVIQSTPAVQLASLPIIEQRFIDLYSKTQGVDSKIAEMVFQQERFHFQKAISESQGLRECEPLSLYGCFMDCAVQGLSFDPKKKLAYLIPGKVNVGSRDEKQYVSRATLEVSPYGELAIRQQLGQIKYADNPVIVYQGDVFEPYEDSSGKGVAYKLSMDHTNVIIAAFIKIVRIDGAVDYSWLLKNDWERLAGYSSKKNFGKPNALYSSNNGQIDPGFLGAKLIKHAFKSYPKVKPIGMHTTVQVDEEVEQKQLSAKDIYGMELPAHDAQFTPTMIVSPPELSENLSTEAKAAIVNAAAPEHIPQPHQVNIPDNGEGF